jgi:hypothetical protein
MKRATPCEKSNSNRRRVAVPSEKKNKRNQQKVKLSNNFKLYKWLR